MRQWPRELPKAFIWPSHRRCDIFPFGHHKALEALGPLHGYGVERGLEQLSEETLRLNEGTLYAALLRLVQKGWIRSEWGASDHNRTAKY